MLNPIEGARDGLLPFRIEFVSSCVVVGWLPRFVDAPVRPHLIGVLPKAGGEPGGIGGTQSRCFGYPRPNYGNPEDVSLELHEQIIVDHATVNFQGCQGDARVRIHCIQNLARLEGGCFQSGTSNVSAVDIAS